MDCCGACCRSTLEERQVLCSPEELKAEIFAHITEVRAERKRVMAMAQNCALRSDWVFQYDDKCGSSYLHLPYEVREVAAMQNRYKYRFGLQANLAPGILLQYSLVPPCLHTGVCAAIVPHLMRV